MTVQPISRADEDARALELHRLTAMARAWVEARPNLVLDDLAAMRPQGQDRADWLLAIGQGQTTRPEGEPPESMHATARRLALWVQVYRERYGVTPRVRVTLPQPERIDA